VWRLALQQNHGSLVAPVYDDVDPATTTSGGRKVNDVNLGSDEVSRNT
jgi:hypothetical protein